MNDTFPRIWVDADSCPALVKNLVLETAASLSLPVTYVANRNIPFTIQNKLFTMYICAKESGAADDYILEHCTEQDIVITRDIPLAKQLVDARKTVINDRGTQFTSKNIMGILEQRELSMQMAALGLHTGTSWNTYGKKELQAFSKCWREVLLQKGITTQGTYPQSH